MRRATLPQSRPRRNKWLQGLRQGGADGLGGPVAVDVDDPVAGAEVLRAAVGGGEAGLEIRLVEELGRAAPRAPPRPNGAATACRTA